MFQQLVLGRTSQWRHSRCSAHPTPSVPHSYRSHCRFPPPRTLRLSHLHSRRRRNIAAQAAQKTYYEILGVSENATEREVKRAYRKVALKLHPDVNKAPDAEAQFMAAKTAFETLSDPRMKSEYDRKRRGGFGSSAGFGSDWGSYSSGSSSTSGARGNGYKPPQEDFYGLDDFFRDLEKEVNEYTKSRSASTSKPKSLWEELEAVGEEFVEFLEGSLGEAVKEAEKQQKEKYGSATSKRGAEKFDDIFSQVEQEIKQASRAPPPPPPPTKKSAEEEIDDMLQALKNKMRR